MEMIFAKPRMAVVDLITCTDRSKPQGKHVEMCRHTDECVRQSGHAPSSVSQRKGGNPSPCSAGDSKKEPVLAA